ncbi:hypothetical protein ACMD2_08215 [Ananas comosus]|uniref:DUF4408 domain-containing protein n=1 Tax=Ananas comosus TaxID=4615 RepID=A0A199VIU9_ANACO|nr:hypothetical protein ACMD2_08215 [Ananas comosus]
MGNLRHGGSGNAGLRVAAVWAAKLGILAAGAAAAAAAARAAAPRVAALVGDGAALPGAWAAARAWLVPPYLFITVHLIILVIWRLSDHKLHRDHSPPPAQEAAEEPAAKPRDLARKPTPESWHEDPAPPPESSESSSCVTTESDEGSTASSRVLGLKRSVKPSPGSVIRVEEEEEEEEEREGEVEGDADYQSMDATWRAIMARSSSAAPAPAAFSAADDAAPAPAPPRARRREEAAATVGGDELTRRFEDFIRRNHDQIRLQREEMMMKNQKMR